MSIYPDYSKEHIRAILDVDYPGYIEVTEKQMKLLHVSHKEIIDRTFDTLHADKLSFVAYVLKPHTFGAIKGMCCNGVRFGENGDYVSLPLLPKRLYKLL